MTKIKVKCTNCQKIYWRNESQADSCVICGKFDVLENITGSRFDDYEAQKQMREEGKKQ